MKLVSNFDAGMPLFMRMQAERGERLGGRSPYGYRKKSPDSKELVPDEEAAAVVRRIFDLCAAGKGPNQIARILAADQVLTPSNYYYRKTGKSHKGLDTTRPYAWCGSTVTGILDSRIKRSSESRRVGRCWWSIPTNH